jgi:glycosyltransferase involved in cell wall biosynthesis
MKNVLLLCEYPTLNGGERSMLAVLDQVRSAGYSVGAWAPPEGPLAETLAARGVDVEPFRASDSQGRRLPLETLRRQSDDVVSRRAPDLVHANSLAMGRLAGPGVAARGIPSLAHLRDIVGLSAQAIADLNCHRRLLAVSQAVCDHHVAAGLDPGKVRVLHNGVDLDAFHPQPSDGSLHRELGLAEGTPLVGAIGQIGLRKGHDVLLSAAAAVLREIPNATFLVVGRRNSGKQESIDFQQRLQRGADELAGRFLFLGRRDDVPRLLREWTLLVHPARQEPLGRVLLEAAASGLAVVATDVGGTREIFPPGQDMARLVPPDDAEALAAAVCGLLQDAEARAALGRAARRRACEAFDANVSAAGLVRHYEELLRRTE